MTNGAKQQPACNYTPRHNNMVFETVEFARKRDKRRRANKLAKAARRKQRK